MEIFLSYPRKNTDKANQLRQALFGGGHTVWMDDQLKAGQGWRDQLEARIKDHDSIVLALTPNWVASPYCQWEFTVAVENGKKVIPVLLAKTDLPERISRYQYADLSAGFDDAKVQKLLKTLLKELKMPPKSRFTTGHKSKLMAQKSGKMTFFQRSHSTISSHWRRRLTPLLLRIWTKPPMPNRLISASRSAVVRIRSHGRATSLSAAK